MPVQVTFSPEDRLIIITYRERTTSTELQLATKQANQYATSYDCYKILVDVREAESAVSPVDVYNMPKLYDSLGIPRNTLIAMVGPKAAAEYKEFLFYETVCRNRGFRVEVFDDMEWAKKWLTGQYQTTQHQGSIPDPAEGVE